MLSNVAEATTVDEATLFGSDITVGADVTVGVVATARRVSADGTALAGVDSTVLTVLSGKIASSGLRSSAATVLATVVLFCDSDSVLVAVLEALVDSAGFSGDVAACSDFSDVLVSFASFAGGAATLFSVTGIAVAGSKIGFGALARTTNAKPRCPSDKCSPPAQAPKLKRWQLPPNLAMEISPECTVTHVSSLLTLTVYSVPNTAIAASGEFKR